MCSYWAIKLVGDMNGDGYFTISDIGLWVKYFFYLPGDFLVGIIVLNYPRFSRFFEIDVSWCHDFLSGLTGFVFWGLCFLMFVWFVVMDEV